LHAFVSRIEPRAADSSKSIALSRPRNVTRIENACCMVSEWMLLPTKYLFRQRIKVARQNWPASSQSYEVVQVVSPIVGQLSVPYGTKAHLAFQTSKLRPHITDATGERTPPPLKPVIVDGFEGFEVE
jgi:hypothetical protein